MAKVKALTNVRDIVTGELHPPGDVFELDRQPEVLAGLMADGVIEILDPVVRPAILVQPVNQHEDSEPAPEEPKE